MGVEGGGQVTHDRGKGQSQSQVRSHPKGKPVRGKEKMAEAREYFQGSDLERDLFYNITSMVA